MIVVGGLECNTTARWRFLSHFTQGDPDECWEWANPERGGYGRFRLGGAGSRRVGAHVFSYHYFVGDYEEPVLDHLCRNTRCVNPAHLEPVSYRENTLRGVSPTAVAHVTNTCKRGHSLEAAYVHDGIRYCRQCRSINERNYRARQRQEASA